MANRGNTSSPEFHSIFVETTLNTRLVVLAHKDEIISDFKDKLLEEHKLAFPDIGEINVSALKVKRRRQFFHFSDSVNVWTAFHGIRRSWFMYVDAARVEKGDEVLTLVAADINVSKLELVEGKKDIAIGMHTKDLTLEEGLKTYVAEKKTTRKRKLISSDGKKSRKKLRDDIVTGEMGKGIESGENKDISMEENQRTCDEDMQLEGKIVTVNSELVEKVKDVPGSETLDRVQEQPDDATCKPCPISESETLLVEAIQKETEMGEKSVEDLVRHDIVIDNQASQFANLLEANSPVTPVTEKKKTRKRSSKDQSVPAASREIANEINKVPGSVDHVDSTTSESRPVSKSDNLGKENEMDEKIKEDVGSVKATPSSADNIQNNTTGPATEKRNRKKSSKDHIIQSSADTTPSKEVMNEEEKVSGSIDATQKEDEIGDKLVDTVGSREATTLVSEDKIQSTSNLQVADLVSTPHTLAQESKTLDKIGDENESREHEVSIEKVDAKSVKSTKKKSSRKAKTPAIEYTLVDSGVQSVDPIKVVDGVEGPDNVIRNVLDSLQQRDEAEENLDKSEKKSSKSSKKKLSLNVVETSLDESGKKSTKRSKTKRQSSHTVEPQVLSVEVNINAAQEEAPPTNNSKHTVALFAPAKNDIETDASHLEKSIQVADNTEDNNLSKEILKEKVTDMGDSVGASQKNDDIVGGGNKQVQMTDGAKTKKEKNLGGSVDGSVKPKERKSRVQPAKIDRSGSKVAQADASVKASVNKKKEAVKKSSNSVTVNKSKVNVNNKKEAVKKSSNFVTVNESKMNFFKDADNSNSSDDESKRTSDVSTKSPPDSSADDDSDVTSMSRKRGNNISGGSNRALGSLQDILRSSKSYKKAKLTASQSQPDEFDDVIAGLDFVPDSQAK